MDKLDRDSAKLLKVEELKSALKSRRCSVSGKKSELYDRLVAFFDSELEANTDVPVEAVINENETLPKNGDMSAAITPIIELTDCYANESMSVLVPEQAVEESSIQDPKKDTKELDGGCVEVGRNDSTITATVDCDVAVSASLDIASLPADVSGTFVVADLESNEAEVIFTHEQLVDTPAEEVVVEQVVNEMVMSQENAAVIIDTEEHAEKIQTSSDEQLNEEETGQASTKNQFHVRVDNFQRPLTDKLLFEWLASTLNHEVSRDQLWMNKIKTHCYIDFDTSELANACIAAVTGQKVDSKHSLLLVAALTKVSASDAENSVEAKMKPNEWRNLKIQQPSVSAPAAVPKATNQSTRIGASSSIDMVQRAAQLATTSVNKAVMTHLSGPGDSIRGNEQIGFSTKRNSAAAGLKGEPVKRQNLGAVSSSKGIPVKEHSERFREQEQDCGGTVELDTLFRKTVALPPLYWLPVSEDVVSRRMQLGTMS